MKLFPLLILCLFPLFGLGQKTKKVVEKVSNYSKDKEVYYVLDSDRSVRHGSYQLISSQKIVLISGHYRNGKKDSLWVEYDGHGTSGGRTILNEGNFSKGEKVGVWKYHNSDGILVQEYDYTHDKLVSTTEKNPDLETTVIINEDTMNVKLDSQLMFKGSNSMLTQHIDKNLNYPQSAVERGLNGKVIVTFTVDTNGVASDYSVENKIGNGFDQAALHAVKQIPNDWIPARFNGSPVKVRVHLPINFTLR